MRVAGLYLGSTLNMWSLQIPFTRLIFAQRLIQISGNGQEILDKHAVKKGGLVLLDIKTNSVLSMVSRPKINQKDPFNDQVGNIENVMLNEQITGSVFKTVVRCCD